MDKTLKDQRVFGFLDCMQPWTSTI